MKSSLIFERNLILLTYGITTTLIFLKKMFPLIWLILYTDSFNLEEEKSIVMYFMNIASTNCGLEEIWGHKRKLGANSELHNQLSS